MQPSEVPKINNLFFVLTNKYKEYLEYRELKEYFKKIDDMIEKGLINVSEDYGFIINDMPGFLKYYFDLSYTLSGEFLSTMLGFRREFIISDDFYLSLDTICMLTYDAGFKIRVNKSTKRNAINELVNKNLIIKKDNKYKLYRLNLNNNDLRSLVECLLESKLL